MANEKYALLDTDFISKMHLIRKDDQNKLIDKIMVIYALSDFLIMILSWLVKQSLRAFLFQEVQP